jgi:plastocyanin
MGSQAEWNYPARMLDRYRLALLPLLLTVAACGDDPKPAPQSGGAQPPAADNANTAAADAQLEPAEPKAADPKAPEPAVADIEPWVGPIDAAKVGVIKGVVRFDGAPPKRLPVPINVTGCNAHATPPLFETVIVENGRLANVFVTISRGLEKVELPAAPAEPAHLDQDGCVYVPHVLGMRTGQKLAVKNGDAVTHNVNVRESKNQTFNQVQAAGSPEVDWEPKKREIGVSFACDLHPWMKAWVCVEEHPFWAVTGNDGAFSLQGLPPGKYTIEAWHEKYKTVTKKVTLAAGGQVDLELAFKP